MNKIKEQLGTYCELHWWNMGRKTLSFKGELKDLLKKHDISYFIKKTDKGGIYAFYFKSKNGISFKRTGLIGDFAHLAKQSLQMELVRMGDKSRLYVSGVWRPTVNVNF